MVCSNLVPGTFEILRNHLWTLCRSHGLVNLHGGTPLSFHLIGSSEIKEWG
ncbi:hypothetical protein QFZ75_001066 [Streptomyces sp. V3I8]|jgi:hypothetical protein|nr:hypothetical protein [Streptomyces sp. V3I8]